MRACTRVWDVRVMVWCMCVHEGCERYSGNRNDRAVLTYQNNKSTNTHTVNDKNKKKLLVSWNVFSGATNAMMPATMTTMAFLPTDDRNMIFLNTFFPVESAAFGFTAFKSFNF